VAWGTWLLALLYERQELFDSFGIELCTSRSLISGTEIRRRHGQLDEDRTTVCHEHAGRVFPAGAMPGNQLESPAKQGMGEVSDLDQLRIMRSV
jgi:hypothetical protein